MSRETFFKVNGQLFIGDLGKCPECSEQCAVNVAKVTKAPADLKYISLAKMPGEYEFTEDGMECCEFCRESA